MLSSTFTEGLVALLQLMSWRFRPHSRDVFAVNPTCVQFLIVGFRILTGSKCFDVVVQRLHFASEISKFAPQLAARPINFFYSVIHALSRHAQAPPRLTVGVAAPSPVLKILYLDMIVSSFSINCCRREIVEVNPG